MFLLRDGWHGLGDFVSRGPDRLLTNGLPGYPRDGLSHEGFGFFESELVLGHGPSSFFQRVPGTINNQTGEEIDPVFLTQALFV